MSAPGGARRCVVCHWHSVGGRGLGRGAQHSKPWPTWHDPHARCACTLHSSPTAGAPRLLWAGLNAPHARPTHDVQVWIISRHYSDDQRMGSLFQRIAREIGDRVEAAIDLRQIFRMLPSDAVELLRTCKSVLEHW